MKNPCKLTIVDRPPFHNEAEAVAHYAAVAIRLHAAPPVPAVGFGLSHPPVPPPATGAEPAPPPEPAIEIEAKPGALDPIVGITAVLAALGRHPTTEDIAHAASRIWRIELATLIGRSRLPCYVQPRQIAMAIAHRASGLNFCAIGRGFARDHGTVMNADRKYGALVDQIIAERGSHAA